MAKQFTLGKNERLKSRKLIEQLFKEGKTFNVFPFRVYYIYKSSRLTGGNPIGNLKFGAGVGTKNFKKAVDRNRIKRITKEAWRLQKNIALEKLKETNASLNVFFIYTAKELPAYEPVYNKVRVILDKLLKLLDEIDTQVS
ncbi:MAG: rnpA [Chitinophagaceae bacterium]|nr:rnpA [Chitinophagaceae bacterium]